MGLLFVHNLLAFCRFAQGSMLIFSRSYWDYNITHGGSRTGEGWRKDVWNIFIITLRSMGFSGSSRTYQVVTQNCLSLTKLQRKFAKVLRPKGVRLENPQGHSPNTQPSRIADCIFQRSRYIFQQNQNHQAEGRDHSPKQANWAADQTIRGKHHAV